MNCQSEQQRIVRWLADNPLDHPERKLAVMGLSDWLMEEIIERYTVPSILTEPKVNEESKRNS